MFVDDFLVDFYEVIYPTSMELVVEVLSFGAILIIFLFLFILFILTQNNEPH